MLTRHFFACLALMAVIAGAISAPDAHADDGMSLVTGPKTGTYYTIGKEVAHVASSSGVAIDAKPSEGSVDNIKRMNSNERAELGIVQSDVLGFLSRSKNPDSMRMAANLRMVFPLYNEEIHVLAKNDIATIRDLHGRKVAIGEDGSGSMLTAINLFAMMEVTPAELHKVPPAQGVVSVLKGDLDAVVVVAGKPVRVFKNLEDLTRPEHQQYTEMLAKLHFLPLDNPKMLEEYTPATLTPADYNFVKEDVKTVAIRAVLVSYDFSQGNKKRCDQLLQLTKALREHLPDLQEKGHPKWNEVALDADTGIWKKDICAWPELVAPPVEEPSPLGKDLIGVIEEKKPVR